MVAWCLELHGSGAVLDWEGDLFQCPQVMKWKRNCQGRQKTALLRLHSRRKHPHPRLGAGVALASVRIRRGLTTNCAMELEECYDGSTIQGLRQPTVARDVPGVIKDVHRSHAPGDDGRSSPFA